MYKGADTVYLLGLTDAGAQTISSKDPFTGVATVFIVCDRYLVDL